MLQYNSVSKLEFDFVTAFVGSVDTVDDCLVVQNLGRRNRSRTALFDGIQEGTDLPVPQVYIAFDFGNYRIKLHTCDVVIQSHGTTDGAIPTVSGRNTERTFGTENDGITGGICVHCPGNTEVQNNIAFQTYKCCCKVVNGESFSVPEILGVLSKLI